MNYFSDEKEWKWLFENGLDWEKILPLYHSSFPTENGHQTPQEVKEFYEELLSATGEWPEQVLPIEQKEWIARAQEL